MTLSLLILWDASAAPPEKEGLVYRWNGYSESNNACSLLRYVETHGQRLRSKYLAWVHDLGESSVNGRRLVDHLVLEGDFSYWWMTLIVEQSPWKSPSITDAIRLLALEEIINQQKPGRFLLVSCDGRLHEVLSDFCRRKGIAYEWSVASDNPSQRWTLQRFYQALPGSLRALLSLGSYVVRRWPFRQLSTSGWFHGAHALFICSYFFNVYPDLARAGCYRSRYWEGLHDFLRTHGLKGNWLQYYVPHDEVPNPQVALEWVKKFSRAKQEQGFHIFFDTYLSWRVVLQVLKRWLWLSFMYWRLRNIKHAFRPQGSHLTLWPLMRGDWQASMCGPLAVSNLLWIELFDKALSDLPCQSVGLYLCENQSWERALIHAWRKRGHGRLVAVVHSTVRFWHLSYFTDIRTLRSSGRYALPQPDVVALNGKAAVDAYLEVDYPRDAIVECEALRYGYLGGVLPMQPSKRPSGSPLRVLVLGDFLPSSTTSMLKLLDAAVALVTDPVAYTVKPHPNFLVKSQDYPLINFSVINDPLENALRDCDIVYSSNMTSAALEAYLVGLPVVVMLNEMELNFSPLRGLGGVRFVSTPGELADVLQSADTRFVTSAGYNDFFFLDAELPRWQRLLPSAETA